MTQDDPTIKDSGAAAFVRVNGIAEELVLYTCGTCRRCFTDEAGIRTHQNLYARLHAHDPEISDHDGHPWVVERFGLGFRGHIGRWWAEIQEVYVDHDQHRWWGVRERDHGPYLSIDDDGMTKRATGSLDADDERVREFAAAIALGLDADEISIDEHIRDRRRRWYRASTGEIDPQAHVEEVQLLARIGLMTFNAARR